MTLKFQDSIQFMAQNPLDNFKWMHNPIKYKFFAL